MVCVLVLPSGDVQLENGVVLSTGSRSTFSLIAKDVTLGNTSIQTQVRLGSNTNGIDLVGVAARRTDTSNQSYFAGITASRLLFISREPGNTVWLGSIPFNPLETDVKLQFDLVDNELSLRAWKANEQMPTAPQVSVTDDTYDMGIVGIVVQDNEGPGMLSGSFRYVQVATSPIATTSASRFSRVIAFGDSVTDSGNSFSLSAGVFPPSPPYFDGRWSNGPLWLDMVSEQLGLGLSVPSLRGGTNYAYGGARSGLGETVTNCSDMGLTMCFDVSVPNSGTQITRFLRTRLHCGQ